MKFIDEIAEKQISDPYYREKAVIWDDAGSWLHALDYHDRFVKSVTKWLSVSATQVCSILFTTPDKQLLVKKVRGLKGIKITQVVKRWKDRGKKKHRIAKVYDLRKTVHGFYYFPQIYEDYFIAEIPKPIFERYYPIRVKYAILLSKILRKEVSEIEREVEYIEDRTLELNEKLECLKDSMRKEKVGIYV